MAELIISSCVQDDRLCQIATKFTLTLTTPVPLVLITLISKITLNYQKFKISER